MLVTDIFVFVLPEGKVKLPFLSRLTKRVVTCDQSLISHPSENIQKQRESFTLTFELWKKFVS